MTAPALVFVVGSPPQVRGKRRAKKVASHIQRITPAGAGKTFFKLRHASRDKDHPRRCGENEGVYLFAPPKRGSPPQVRGKQSASSPTSQKAGITPAGAGKTGGYSTRRFFSKDHPRRCGENVCGSIQGRTAVGSPPQVRGKLCQELHGVFDRGITPAGAGKTLHAELGSAEE